MATEKHFQVFINYRNCLKKYHPVNVLPEKVSNTQLVYLQIEMSVQNWSLNPFEIKSTLIWNVEYLGEKNVPIYWWTFAKSLWYIYLLIEEIYLGCCDNWREMVKHITQGNQSSFCVTLKQCGESALCMCTTFTTTIEQFFYCAFLPLFKVLPYFVIINLFLYYKYF